VEQERKIGEAFSC